jgi:DNA-binding MarR family transcriptional regulator
MSEIDPVVPDAARELRQSVMRLSRRLRQEQPVHGLGLTKMTFLSHLDRADAATTSELAAAEGVAQQSAARPIAEMVEAGLICREPDPRDGRQVLLRLSSRGRHLLEADLAQRDAWLAEAMAERLTDVERDLLVLSARLLDRLVGPL